MKLFEMKSVKYILPDFINEYNEVKHQHEVNNYFKTKKKWLEIAKTGKQYTLTNSQLHNLSNHDHRFSELEKEKRDRVSDLFRKGAVEMPIVLKDGNLLHLLAGNTRLAFARKNGFKPTVWLIDAPELRNYF